MRWQAVDNSDGEGKTVDPAGRGRVRSVAMRRTSGWLGWSPVLYGTVVWGGQEDPVEENTGNVSIKTSALGRVRLDSGNRAK